MSPDFPHGPLRSRGEAEVFLQGGDEMSSSLYSAFPDATLARDLAHLQSGNGGVQARFLALADGIWGVRLPGFHLCDCLMFDWSWMVIV